MTALAAHGLSVTAGEVLRHSFGRLPCGQFSVVRGLATHFAAVPEGLTVCLGIPPGLLLPAYREEGIVGGVLSSLLGALIRLPGLVRLVGGSGLFAAVGGKLLGHFEVRPGSPAVLSGL